MIRSLPASARDVALLVARIVVGVVLIAHGWQKLGMWGMAASIEAFTAMGIPLPAVSAVIATVVELVGGALLLVGAATAVVGVISVLNMLGATLLVHISNGVFVDQGGWELTGVIGAVALVLAAVGAGRYSVDQALAGRRATARV
jgi:putative oxidoreductase